MFFVRTAIPMNITILGEKTMLTAIVGINWGDEVKGRMFDMISEKYEIFVR